MHIKNLFLLSFAVSLIATSICEAQPSSGESKTIGKFSKELNDDLKKDNLHGSISAAIIKDRKVLWAGAFGYAGREKDIAADTGTVYRIGSITKTFTAVILMQLVEEGKVRLDDPVENYVPEVRSLRGYSKGTRITLRELASHTSGLKREPDLAGASVGPTEQWESKVLSSIPYTSFDSDPREKFLYSNIGFALLGLALERASGVPYLQMVQQRIFIPLHMDHSFFLLPEDEKDKMAEGIENTESGRVNTETPMRELEGRGYRVPNGGIFSTPLDLAKFVIALQTKSSLLRPESLREMLTIPQGGKNYGLGLMITRSPQLDMIGHDGSVAGYTAEFAIEQRGGYAVIFMRNYNFGQTDLIATAKDWLERL